MLPEDVWKQVLSFIPFGRGRTFRALSETCRRLYAVLSAEHMWHAQLLLLYDCLRRERPRDPVIALSVYSALVSHQTEAITIEKKDRNTFVCAPPVGFPAASSMEMLPMGPEYMGSWWTWKNAFLHFTLVHLGRRCAVCLKFEGPANGPFSAFSVPVGDYMTPRQSRWQKDQQSENDHTAQPIGELGIVDWNTFCALRCFPFQGCSLCGVCLRKYCWPLNSPSGRRELGRRRFYRMHRWEVCIRRDAVEVLDNTAVRGSIRIGHCAAAPTHRAAPENVCRKQDRRSIDNFSVKVFVAEAFTSLMNGTQHLQSRRDPDPLGILSFPGHSQ